jgi:hypothetical protein
MWFDLAKQIIHWNNFATNARLGAIVGLSDSAREPRG